VIRLTGPEPENSAESLRRLLEMQSDFAARLSDETLRYLRNLQGVIGPTAPGTVVLAESGTVLDAEGRPDETVALELEVVNEQVVYGVVAPALSPLVSGQGGTWFPQAAVNPPYQLVEPQGTRRIAVTITVPHDIPPDTYRGMILFPGNPNGVGVAIRVPHPPPTAPVPDEKPAATTNTRPPTARRRPAASKAATGEPEEPPTTEPT
jgi:hypothetical protein